MYAAKSGSKAGRYGRSIIVLALVLVLLLIAAYVALPQLLSALLRHALASQGFADASVNISYPRWGKVRFIDVRAKGRAFGQIVELRLDDVDVDFELRDLMDARVGSVRIASARATLVPAPLAPTDVKLARPLSVVALLPGQWLLWLPAREVVLETAQIEWHRAADSIYHAQFSGHARRDEARLDGTISPPEPAQALYFLGQARAGGEVELTAWPDDRTEPALRLAATLTSGEADNVELSGRARARLESLLPFVAPQALSMTGMKGLRGGLEAQWQARLPSQSTADLASFLAKSELKASGSLLASAQRIGETLYAPEVDVRSRVRLDRGVILWHLAEGSRVAVGLNLKAHAASPRIDVDFPGGWSGGLRLENEELTLTVDRDARLRLQPVEVLDLVVPATTLTFAEAFELSSNDNGQWHHGPLRLTISASPINWREYQISHDGIVLQLDARERADDFTGERGTIAVNDLSARIGAYELKPAKLHAQFESDSQQFSSQARLSAAGGTAIVNASVVHRLAVGDGSARALLEPATLGMSGVTLKGLFERFPYPLELTAGKVHANGALSWRRKNDHQFVAYDDRFSLRVQDMGGSYDDITFGGVSADMTLADLDAPHTTEPAKLQAKMVNIGVLVENIQATGRLDTEIASGQPVIALTQIGAELLGGTARSERVEWSPARERTTFGVRLEHLEVAEIMKLQRQEGLEGSGLLDGYLPVELTSAGVALRGGAIAARSPGGTIRYRPAASVAELAKSNPSVALVLGALSDFRYDSLDVGANSTPEGDLTLQLQLKGANPDWQSGRPVHLNLNVEENIPDLLRSLRLAGEVSDELGKRVQERYQQKR